MQCLADLSQTEGLKCIRASTYPVSEVVAPFKSFISDSHIVYISYTDVPGFETKLWYSVEPQLPWLWSVGLWTELVQVSQNFHGFTLVNPPCHHGTEDKTISSCFQFSRCSCRFLLRWSCHMQSFHHFTGVQGPSSAISPSSLVVAAMLNPSRCWHNEEGAEWCPDLIPFNIVFHVSSPLSKSSPLTSINCCSAFWRYAEADFRQHKTYHKQ